MSDIENRLAESKKSRGHMSLGDLAKEGVTVAFLSQVFRMDPNKVKRKLVNCPVLDSRQRGQTQVQHIYDLATAAEYLVEPKADIATIVSRLKPEDLPPRINTAFWDAALKRQRYEENAGELWRTEKVREVLGGMFQTIKFTMQLWADNVERMHGLTKDQRDTIHNLVDQLQQDIYDHLVKEAHLSRTGPLKDDIPNMLSRSEKKVPSDVVTQDDFDSLI